MPFGTGNDVGDFSDYGTIRSTGVPSDSESSEVAYIKIGNKVECWGKGNIEVAGTDRSTWASNTDPLIISIFGVDTFPYTNDANFYIDVDVTILSEGTTSFATTDLVNSDYNVFGRIYPGDSNIYLFKRGINGNGDEIYTVVPLKPQDLVDNNNPSTQWLHYSFKFSMPVDYNSYNRSYYDTSPGGGGGGAS